MLQMTLNAKLRIMALNFRLEKSISKHQNKDNGSECQNEIAALKVKLRMVNCLGKNTTISWYEIQLYNFIYFHKM